MGEKLNDNLWDEIVKRKEDGEPWKEIHDDITKRGVDITYSALLMKWNREGRAPTKESSGNLWKRIEKLEKLVEELSNKLEELSSPSNNNNSSNQSTPWVESDVKKLIKMKKNGKKHNEMALHFGRTIEGISKKVGWCRKKGLL